MQEHSTPGMLTDPAGICSCALKCACWKPLTASRPDQYRPRTLRQLRVELGERLRCTTGSSRLPQGPGLAGTRVRCGRVKDIECRAGVRTLDHAPTGAVPVLDQRLRAGAIVEPPHGPDVAGGDGGDSSELVKLRAGVGAGDHAPTAAVPLLDQRSAAAVSHGPHIGGGDGGYPQEG